MYFISNTRPRRRLRGFFGFIVKFICIAKKKNAITRFAIPKTPISLVNTDYVYTFSSLFFVLAFFLPLIARSAARTRLVNPGCISRARIAAYTHTYACVYMKFYTVPLLHEARWPARLLSSPHSTPPLGWTKREQLVRRRDVLRAYPSQYPTLETITVAN